MRMDPTQALTPATIVNRSSESDLVVLISRYGEERWARRIARGIVRRRAADDHRRRSRSVFAMRCHAGAPGNGFTRRHGRFQAVRIAVNREWKSSRRRSHVGFTGCDLWGTDCRVASIRCRGRRIIKRAFSIGPGGRDTARDHAPTRSTIAWTRSRK